MVNVVTTQKNVVEVGKEMCQNKVVKKMSFTGSTGVAKMLAGLASTTLKKCVPARTPDEKETHAIYVEFQLRQAGTRLSLCLTTLISTLL